MSNSDFRQIARKGIADKAERLFRASISAYCCLSYPTRAEAQQLEDLTLPLYNAVTPETLRYVSAALSECVLPPHALIARLCNEAPEISAPLLVRTKALSDLDLISLIARKGVTYARVIARRQNLHPTIAALASMLERKARSEGEMAGLTSGKGSALGPLISGQNTKIVAERTAEETRRALRAMMSAPSKPELRPDEAYRRLRDAALSGSSDLFHLALADILGVDEATARMLVTTSDHDHLLAALRSLELPDERAFLLMACAFPNQFPHPVSIRLFFERYEGLGVDMARDRVRSLRAEALANAFQQQRRRPKSATKR